MSLTGAELRLLPYLATHLTFPEIAARLFISRNTVKTEAVAVYRKLGVSSRSEAIERAIALGLLDGSIYPPRAISSRRGDAPADQADRCAPGGIYEYRQHLRRLAVHDDALLEAIAVEEAGSQGLSSMRGPPPFCGSRRPSRSTRPPRPSSTR